MLAPGIAPAAMDLAHRMRAVMALDLDEYEVADRVREFNDEHQGETGFADAWYVLATHERAAWRTYLTHRRPDEHGYRTGSDRPR